jgi:hypothetical protein
VCTGRSRCEKENMCSIQRKKPDLIKSGEGRAAVVSLNDCLACSGCVTTAEAVLVSQQSTEEVKRRLADTAYRWRVISVSPQTLAAMSVRYGVESVAEVYCRLVAFLRVRVGGQARSGSRHRGGTQCCRVYCAVCWVRYCGGHDVWYVHCIGGDERRGVGQ